MLQLNSDVKLESKENHIAVEFGRGYAVLMDAESPRTIADLARALKRKYRSNVDAASAIGTTGTTVKRWLSGLPMSLESALRIGPLVGIPGDIVLQAAGRTEELALITQQFGASANARSAPMPSDTAMAVAWAFDRLEPKQQKLLVDLLDFCGHPVAKAKLNKDHRVDVRTTRPGIHQGTNQHRVRHGLARRFEGHTAGPAHRNDYVDERASR